jgi:hypothetical protein
VTDSKTFAQAIAFVDCTRIAMPQPAEWQAIGEDPEKFAAFVKAANRQGIKIRRDREHLLLICYGKSLDTLRTELQDSMPPVSLDPYGAGASSFAKTVF